MCQCPFGLVLPPPGTLTKPPYPLKKPIGTDPSGSPLKKPFVTDPSGARLLATLLVIMVSIVSMPSRAGTSFLLQSRIAGIPGTVKRQCPFGFVPPGTLIMPA